MVDFVDFLKVGDILIVEGLIECLCVVGFWIFFCVCFYLKVFFLVMCLVVIFVIVMDSEFLVVDVV